MSRGVLPAVRALALVLACAVAGFLLAGLCFALGMALYLV